MSGFRKFSVIFVSFYMVDRTVIYPVYLGSMSGIIVPPTGVSLDKISLWRVVPGSFPNTGFYD